MFKDKQRVKEYLQITLGTLIVACGFYFFFSPNQLVTGGATGISIILEEVTGISNVIYIWVFNIFLLLLGTVVLGKKFFYKTVYGTIMLSLLITLLGLIFKDLNILSEIEGTSSKLLIAAVLGGFLSGLGLGLVFKNNATTGGTDVIQTILYKKFNFPYSVALYIVDGVVLIAGLLIFKIEHTFYAIIAMSIAGFVIDKVMVYGKSGYTVFIVTTEYHALKEAIYGRVNRGVTKVPAVGGYSESDKDMIICTISRNQLYSIKQIISEIDPKAFSIITKTTESVGIGFH